MSEDEGTGHDGGTSGGGIPDVSGTPKDDISDVQLASVTHLRPAKPRARRPASNVQVSPFGAVPVRCTTWGIKRADQGGRWEALSYGSGGIVHKEWPTSELSEETIKARWGFGLFRVMWFEPTAGGGRKFSCMGREVEFRAPPVAAVVQPSAIAAAAAPAPVAASDPFSSLDSALRVMTLIDDRADAKIDSISKLAQALGGRSSGISGEDMLRVLREERAHNSAQIDALRAEIRNSNSDDDDDDDGVASGVAQAATAGASLIKGKGTLAQVLNFAAANPEIAKPVIAGALPILAVAIGKIAELFTPPPSPPRARAIAPAPVAAAPPSAAPPPEPEPAPEPRVSLNGWEVREPPKAPKVESGVGDRA